MKLEHAASGTAKAGLTTGIIGASLGALNLMGNAGGLLNGLVGGAQPCMTARAGWNGCCNAEDEPVSRYDAAKDAKIAHLETQVALRDANTFTDQKFLELYKYIDGELRDIRAVQSNQAVHNQKTADSFQIMQERLQCCCDKMETRICAEENARKCADNTIVNYMNATFYPKQVADVTTGTTTTAQTLYNPLPINVGDNCNC